jgi:hypothetical protein
MVKKSRECFWCSRGHGVEFFSFSHLQNKKKASDLICCLLMIFYPPFFLGKIERALKITVIVA